MNTMNTWWTTNEHTENNRGSFLQCNTNHMDTHHRPSRGLDSLYLLDTWSSNSWVFSAMVLTLNFLSCTMDTWTPWLAYSRLTVKLFLPAIDVNDSSILLGFRWIISDDFGHHIIDINRRGSYWLCMFSLCNKQYIRFLHHWPQGYDTTY
jgi:hypothetical protein